MPIFYKDKEIKSLNFEKKDIGQVYYGDILVWQRQRERIKPYLYYNIIQIDLYPKATTGSYRASISKCEIKVDNTWIHAEYEATAQNKNLLNYDLTYNIFGKTYKVPMTSNWTCWGNTQWGVNAVFMRQYELTSATYPSIIGYLNANNLTSPSPLGKPCVTMTLDVKEIFEGGLIVNGIRFINSAGNEQSGYYSGGFKVYIYSSEDADNKKEIGNWGLTDPSQTNTDLLKFNSEQIVEDFFAKI